LALGGPDIHHSWPPPDVDIRTAILPDDDGRLLIDPFGPGRTRFYAWVASADDWPPGRYWTTLGNFLASISWPSSAVLTRELARYERTVAAGVSTFLSWPIFYDSTIGDTVRWIRHTLRGTLNSGVEQFQHKMDWGVPGSDPDISEAEGDALAVVMATAWKSAWTDAGIGASDLFSTNVKYTESGIVQLTQTSATDSHGVGDAPEESFGTSWFMWPVGSEPVGTGSTISLPFEVCCAVSLQTDHRGPSGKGRLYLPPPDTAVMAANGVFGSGHVKFGQVVAKYVENGMGASPYVPIVVSRRRLILNAITSINTGVVPDSQRRRRKSQDEARTNNWTEAGGII
jgi:hypothetical protein